MIKTTAINFVNPEPMVVTWDLGRRCNYDCTYCESTRHDNISAHHSLDEFKSTFSFIKQWVGLYNEHRNEKTNTSINFTGGEPTVNPNFWDLVSLVKNDSPQFNLSLTTNGAWNKKKSQMIVDNFNGVTVSYHAEAHENLKKQVIENIIELSKSDVWLQVNVMLHVDFWDECVSVYELLKSKGIRVNPRPICDGTVANSGWFQDADGSMRRTSHSYDEKQQEWFWAQMGIEKPAEQRQEGTSLGRGCCGGKCITGKVNGDWESVKIVNTNFKNWNCMVDWYFLHIDQHTGLVYHHQTCQALHDKKRGAVGSLKDSEKIIEDLRLRLDNPQPIICPNQRCGCGMCIPKAEEKSEFDIIWKSLVKQSF
jgi:MoaA/NifB/PqqE/SkfB family radical SAM enzyme